MERLSSNDPAFAQDLHALWTLTRTDSTAHDDAVVNTFQGTAEKVIQLRDVHGDFNL